MGVYIKGMEIPTRCGRCDMRIPVYDDGIFDHYECCITAAIIDNLGEKMEDCPLVPVPPHGRLIDADDLRQSLKDSIDECHNWADEIEGGEMYARVSQSLGTFVECSLRVKAAPTIIPAEEEE